MEKEVNENKGDTADGVGNRNEVEDGYEDEDEEEDVDFNPLLKDSPSQEASSSLSSENEGLDADVMDSEEVVTQTETSTAGECKKGSEIGSLHEKSEGSGSRMFVDGDLVAGEFSPAVHSGKPVINMDDEDAICMRTRARYSLASFTLDELETFLQETDDDDDLQNVDDEEEYKKFLAAVLLGGDGDPQSAQENDNVDDEDEENDADFELEIEEALESDIDEDARDEIQEEVYDVAGRRPKTRQNRRKKASVEGNKKLLGQSKRPLRPLLPSAPLAQRLPFSTLDGKSFIMNHAADFPPSTTDGSINGFSPHQIGQLHCLIHEHVQLLVQVFSICVLEPSRRHIAAKVQELIKEILHSLRDGHGPEGSFWMPYINGPVLSVMDVAPLRLVGNFVDDVSAVVQEYHRRQVGLTCDTRSEREPLFPLSCFPASEPCDQILRGADSPTLSVAHLSPKSDRTPKKTMASALVERAKKQSVALVPKEIAEIAQRFYPLFNPALYPHKPPPAPLANRVLFTEAEDELLALGLMEYNTDWKAIQQRFLPCKSKHQIFVRQKNRSSSKAPENPIKAVRRMKNSPLTADEIARIEEGLKIFKLDWMSIWKFFVPYRDPSLLPRQWRIANGTQKSYKCDATKNAKRQLYERNRRASKPAALPNWQTSPEKEDNSTDKVCVDKNNVRNQMDREEESYVHEAFLADWGPGTSNLASSFPNSQQQEKSPLQPPLQEGSQVSEQLHRSGSEGAQAPIFNEFPAAVRSSSSQVCGRPYRARRVNNARLVKLAPDLPPVNLPPSVRVMSQSAFKSYQGGATVQPSSANSSVIGPGAEAGVGKVVKHTANSGVCNSAKAGQITISPVNANTSNRQPRDSLIIRNKDASEERDESDLQMHPLLFQAPENSHFPYYPLHSSASTSRSFNFFAGSPPQLNLSLFHNPRHANSAVNFLAKSLKPSESGSSCRVDFHPLLQRSEDVNSSSVAACSTAQFSANLETSEGRCAQVQSPLGGTPSMCRAHNSSAASAVSPGQKINELDLDICLSSTSRQHKALGSEDVNECGTAVSVANTKDFRNLGSPMPKDSLKQSSQYMPVAYAPDKIGSKLDSGVHAVVVASDEGNRSSADNTEDQSLPEIVMEQEELSDSEDEVGENVEFECEEMADSEAEEGSDSDQMVDMQNEDVEKADADADSNDQQDDPIRCDDSEGNAFQTVEGRQMGKKIDHSSSSLSLNLNSCPPGSPLMKKPNNGSLKGSNTAPDEKVHSGARAATENIASNDDNVASQKQVVELGSQSNLNSGITSSKKPRKRACGPDLRLRRGTPKRRNTSLKTDMNSAKSKQDS
ncbi:unnamed protein product [Coffea canephora]|uniref:Myb-like domain-containing protein n=1 Tax=Coffea canephora TaxID=49390 RepID=A0A068U7B7_COFCA|nr:unnamed protein product [Coffea canephora]